MAKEKYMTNKEIVEFLDLKCKDRWYTFWGVLLFCWFIWFTVRVAVLENGTYGNGVLAGVGIVTIFLVLCIVINKSDKCVKIIREIEKGGN
jgi:hypothetical protein